MYKGMVFEVCGENALYNKILDGKKLGKTSRKGGKKLLK